MSRRFEGAITTPDEAQDSSRLPAAERPRRPRSIEASAAILIVGGIVAIVGTSARHWASTRRPPTLEPAPSSPSS
jgi:hypothetical protein